LELLVIAPDGFEGVVVVVTGVETTAGVLVDLFGVGTVVVVPAGTVLVVPAGTVVVVPAGTVVVVPAGTVVVVPAGTVLVVPAGTVIGFCSFRRVFEVLRSRITEVNKTRIALVESAVVAADADPFANTGSWLLPAQLGIPTARSAATIIRPTPWNLRFRHF
jgi:uncharacterized cupin superfamily protein